MSSFESQTPNPESQSTPVQDMRAPGRFVRVHRATIVNVAFIQELHPGVDGLLRRLKDGRNTELSVARDRARALKERLGI